MLVPQTSEVAKNSHNVQVSLMFTGCFLSENPFSGGKAYELTVDTEV